MYLHAWSLGTRMGEPFSGSISSPEPVILRGRIVGSGDEIVSGLTNAPIRNPNPKFNSNPVTSLFIQNRNENPRVSPVHLFHVVQNIIV